MSMQHLDGGLCIWRILCLPPIAPGNSIEEGSMNIGQLLHQCYKGANATTQDNMGKVVLVSTSLCPLVILVSLLLFR